MRALSRVALDLALALGFGHGTGCENREAEELARVQHQVCACADVRCAEAAMRELPRPAVKSSHRAQVVARDMLDCLAKLYAAQRPSTDPDGGSAGSDVAIGSGAQ